MEHLKKHGRHNKKYNFNRRDFNNVSLKQVMMTNSSNNRLLDTRLGGGTGDQQMLRTPQEPAVIFYASKNESFKLGDNYKLFHRKLKNRFNFKVIQ